MHRVVNLAAFMPGPFRNESTSCDAPATLGGIPYSALAEFLSCA
jgi:hypothetical protein